MAFPDPRLISGREVGVNFADFGQNAPGLNADSLPMGALAERASFLMRLRGKDDQFPSGRSSRAVLKQKTSCNSID